jgi:hypothetical protein
MTDYTPLLKRFPSVALTKETSSIKEVNEPNSVYLAQPCGKRAFIWFTYFKTKNVCFLLDIKDKVPINIYPVHAAFSSVLSLGTVLHGTVIHYQGTRCFIVDNIFYYKGKTTQHQTFETKLTLLQTVLQTEIDNHMYLLTQVMFSLPVYSYVPTCFDTIYKMYCVKCVHLTNNKVTNFQDRTAVWTVKAIEKCDSYELVNDHGVSQGLACVESYERSVKLNDLFRAIPENHNLDASEESDDEAPSVYTDRSYKMMCRWHPLHKQWVPLTVI